MSYTDAEVAAAVEKLVRTSIRRSQGSLGNRETGVTFNDYQDAAAGVFILYQNAPFYLVYLAARNLRRALQTEREALAEFIDVVEATYRSTTPIANLGPLANARVALDGLLLASASRTSSFQSIEDVPAYQRFEQNTQRFLDESSKNIRSGGELVRTPARSLIATYYTTVKEAHEDVLRRVSLLETAITDFNGLNLPSTLAESILENSRDSIQAWYTELQGLPERDRLQYIRAATLDILAARSTVVGFSSLTGPTDFVPLEGSGGVYADATHLATPASLNSSLVGPYSILEGVNLLHLELEGDSTALEVAGSFHARVEGTIYGPYDIGVPSSAGLDNNELRIQLLNFASWWDVDTFDVVFSYAQYDYEAWEACGVINFSIPLSPNYPLLAEPYANPLKWGGPVELEIVLGDCYVTSLSSVTDYGALGIIEGAYILITDTDSANHNSVLQVKAGGVGTDILVCDLVFDANGGWTDELGANARDVRITDDELPIRLRLAKEGDKAIRWDKLPDTWTNEAKDGYPDLEQTALGNKWGIAVPASGADTDELQLQTASTLGLYIGVEVFSRRTTAELIAANVTESPAAAIDGVARVAAETFFTASEYSGRGRTDPFNFLKVVCSKFNQEGVEATDGGGNSYSFAVTGAATAGVTAGDLIAIRGSSDADDIGLFDTVTNVSDTEVQVTFSQALQGVLTDLDIEIGPDLTVPGQLDHDATAVISDNPGNDGAYGVLDSGTVPFELELDRPLPLPADGANLPFYFDLEVGYYGVAFNSLDETVATAVVVTDGGGSTESCADRFFSSLPASGVGTTTHFQLPEWNKQLTVGDLLELHDTQFNDPTYSVAIESLEQDQLLVLLASALPTSTPQYTLTAGTPVPFARIRNARLSTYSTLQAALETWLGLAANTAWYFPELLRLLNPLVVNTKPSIDQVGDAKTHLEVLDSTVVVLDGLLEEYTADVVPEIDVLLASLQEKGADRARDILLEAQFSTFFGMSMDETSYSGTVQARLKEINREDLPVRKDNRTGLRSAQSELIAAYDEPDYEYDISDMDEAEELDIPAGSTY